MRRDANGDLVSCSGSLEIMDLPAGGQLVLDMEVPGGPGQDPDEGVPTLF